MAFISPAIPVDSYLKRLNMKCEDAAPGRFSPCYIYFTEDVFVVTFEGWKLAAAMGTPRAVKVASHRPPRRMKNEPGFSSPHEYRPPSFRDEYSFTYHITRLLSVLNCRY